MEVHLQDKKGDRAEKPYRYWIIAALIAYASCVTGYCIWSAQRHTDEAMAHIDQQLLQAARQLKYILADDFHDRATGPESISLSEADRNRIAISAMAADSELEYLYTLIEDDGKFYFSAPTVTAEELKQRRNWYYFPYEDAPEGFSRAIETGETTFLSYSDQWGTFRSVAVPQTSPGGRKYLACADAEISYIQRQRAAASMEALATAMGFFLLCVPFVLIYRANAARVGKQNVQLNRYQNRLQELVDIQTEHLRKARDLAESANKTKGQFLANMSHEVRTPMNCVVGMADMLLETKLASNQRNYARAIRDSASNLLCIINDILDYSRIESGKLEVEAIATDLRDEIDRTITMFQHSADKKQLDLQAIIADDIPPAILTDPVRLRQILTNLIGNAIKFTEKGFVRIEAILKNDEHENGLVIAVQDSGVGIPLSKQRCLFEAFQQADSSTHRKFGGSGLGLAISQQLASLMGGYIEFESTEGKGSRFWVWLPCKATDQRYSGGAASKKSQQAMAANAERAAATNFDITKESQFDAAADGQGLRVLLVEDNQINQVLTSAMLQQLGHSPDIAGDGKQAIEKYRNQPYELVLMDCHMPDIDGYQCARLLRKYEQQQGLEPSIIIALTASIMPEDRRKCKEAGMNDFVTKPISKNMMQSLLKQWVHKSSDSEATSDA